MKNLIIILIILIAHIDQKKSDISDKFFKISYENLLKNKKILFLSQVASDVRYVKLETNPACLINNRHGVKFFLTDRLIFVQNVDHVLKFSSDGRFIKKIGNPGRGPGEMGLITSMSVIPDKKMIVIHYRTKLTFLSFNGDLVKSINIPYHQEVNVLNDSRYISYDPGTNGSEKYNFILVSNKGDTISVVKNYTTWKKTYRGTVMVTNPSNEASFYKNNNLSYFKSKYNDTVYFFNAAKDKIEPSYMIDFGRYKVPEELIPEKVASDPLKFQAFKEKAVNYYLGKPFEASSNVFIRSTCMWNGDIKYLIFNKIRREGFLLVDEAGESTGIINDWDGGVDFWPTMQKSNNEVIMPIETLEFKKNIENRDHNKRIVRYPVKQKALADLKSQSDELDNPIIMVVNLKSKF